MLSGNTQRPSLIIRRFVNDAIERWNEVQGVLSLLRLCFHRIFTVREEAAKTLRSQLRLLPPIEGAPRVPAFSERPKRLREGLGSKAAASGSAVSHEATVLLRLVEASASDIRERSQAAMTLSSILDEALPRIKEAVDENALLRAFDVATRCIIGPARHATLSKAASCALLRSLVESSHRLREAASANIDLVKALCDIAFAGGGRKDIVDPCEDATLALHALAFRDWRQKPSLVAPLRENFLLFEAPKEEGSGGNRQPSTTWTEQRRFMLASFWFAAMAQGSDSDDILDLPYPTWKMERFAAAAAQWLGAANSHSSFLLNSAWTSAVLNFTQDETLGQHWRKHLRKFILVRVSGTAIS